MYNIKYYENYFENHKQYLQSFYLLKVEEATRICF